jgi:iron complex transport system permease protein
LSGAILQGYFRNPMADPFVVGVSSAASLGAVVASAVGFEVAAFGFSGPGLLAFLSGLAIVSLVYALSVRRGGFKVETLLLTGIAAGALASALTSFLLFMRSDSYDPAVFWLLGSFQLAEWGQAASIAPWIVLCLLAALWLARDMDLLALGDETARSLGSPVGRVRKAFLAMSALLAALSVAVSGVIGFVGLVVPHWVRILIGPGHRSLFAASALAGGTFLVYCDLIARNILSAELPIGVITAAVGAPFFLYLLHKKR